MVVHLSLYQQSRVYRGYHNDRHGGGARHPQQDNQHAIHGLLFNGHNYYYAHVSHGKGSSSLGSSSYAVLRAISNSTLEKNQRLKLNNGILTLQTPILCFH